jgi:hypothetical protein
MAYNPCGTDGGALVLNDELLKNIFVRGERILGKAVFAAKCSVIARYPTQDTMYGPAVLYTLFGDPALRLKVPGLTGIRTGGTGVPPVTHDAAFEVLPNPVNGSTTIRYSLPVSGHVDLRLFDATGKLVAVLVSRNHPAGVLSCVLSPASLGLGGGVYVLELKLRSHELRLTRKLIIK